LLKFKQFISEEIKFEPTENGSKYTHTVGPHTVDHEFSGKQGHHIYNVSVDGRQGHYAGRVDPKHAAQIAIHGTKVLGEFLKQKKPETIWGTAINKDRHEGKVPELASRIARKHGYTYEKNKTGGTIRKATFGELVRRKLGFK
jgi:hypothetical protein